MFMPTSQPRSSFLNVYSVLAFVPFLIPPIAYVFLSVREGYYFQGTDYDAMKLDS